MSSRFHLETLKTLPRDRMLDELLALELRAGRRGVRASREILESRCTTHPEGVLLLKMQDRAVAAGTAMRMDYRPGSTGLTSWSRITDQGRIRDQHKPEGNALFIVSLSISPEVAGLGADEMLLAAYEFLALRSGMDHIMATTLLSDLEPREELPPEELLRRQVHRHEQRAGILECLYEQGFRLETVLESPEQGEDAEGSREALLCRFLPATPRTREPREPDLESQGTTISLPGDADSLPGLLDLARTLLPSMGLVGDDPSRMVLALEETVLNAMEHGYEGCGGRLRVSIARIPGGARIVVQENGAPFPCKMAQLFADGPAARGPGGRGLGLTLIQSMVDDAWWITREDGTKEFWLLKWSSADPSEGH